MFFNFFVVAVAGQVYLSADGDQLPKLKTTGHSAGVADAEPHEDRGDYGHDVDHRVAQGLQETRPVPGL